MAFLGASWSLSTEWQFYLLIALLGERLGHGVVGLRRVVWLFLALAAMAITWRFAVPETWQFSRAFLPNKAQYFALGIASAVLVRQGSGARHFYALMLLATLGLSFVQGGTSKLLPPLLWTCCLAAQLHPRHAILRPVAAGLCSRPLVWLGAVSYCVYLVHEPLQKLLAIGLVAVVRGDPTLFTLLWLPSAVLLPLGAAWWLHVRVEVPALRWGRALARRGLTARTTVPVSAG